VRNPKLGRARNWPHKARALTISPMKGAMAMDDGYRLASVCVEGGARLMVERQERLLPLLDLLTGAEREKLPAAPADLGPLLPDWPFWQTALAARVSAAAGLFASSGLPASQARFKPPLAAAPKLICIGANYHDHIAEMKVPMTPSYPYSFIKPASNTLRGSGEAVAVPYNVRMMDWEAELAVIIGKPGYRVPASAALELVAGYANYNDLSARDWLATRPGVGIDWVRHKAFDGFGPMGPYFVPAAFVPDPQDLEVRLWVNGVLKQDSHTSQMVFGVAAIIEHLTSVLTLEPGDVIATGTPAGTGFGAEPQQFLHAGDTVRIEIGALGSLCTPIGT
jgi:2-keto-4-pentenoate hydratase/2-oxohepta-3-ene-1,7-dioic acid hydratase in catechol pathway